MSYPEIKKIQNHHLPKGTQILPIYKAEKARRSFRCPRRRVRRACALVVRNVCTTRECSRLTNDADQPAPRVTLLSQPPCSHSRRFSTSPCLCVPLCAIRALAVQGVREGESSSCWPANGSTRRRCDGISAHAQSSMPTRARVRVLYLNFGSSARRDRTCPHTPVDRSGVAPSQPTRRKSTPSREPF